MYPYGEEQGDQEISYDDIINRRCPEEPINNGLYFFGGQHFVVFVSI